jgi:penicillin-binding protein 1C
VRVSEQRTGTEAGARRIIVLLIACAALIVLLDAVFPPPEPPPYSAQVLDRDGSLLSAFLSTDQKWRLRTRIAHVSPELLRAILAKEDRYFLVHPGVNIFAVVRALLGNLAEGKRVSGASTITMQVARLLEPGPRTYAVKLREALRALQLERRYSKREILELYVSLLPMGGNIEGVTSASWIYFNRPPDKLSLAQCVALAVLPNDPNALRLDRRAAPLQNATRRWLRRFRADGRFPAELIDEALSEELQVARNAPPQQAPHFTLMLRQRKRGDILLSTIDAGIQDAAERLLFHHVQRVMAEGVGNGAVLVIRNDNMDVAAWVGSADFFDAMQQGQVNGVTAVRSPGSTLKPFLFARAFDVGSLTPQIRLLDVPSDFNGYAPDNFDGAFQGEVTVRNALLQSRNIPAVRELARQGTGTFITWLRQLGFAEIGKREQQLGLSLILGGCGATLEELTRAYSVFARGGRLAPLRYLRDESHGTGQHMLTPAAAYLVSDILVDHERPDFPREVLDVSRLPHVAFKTGTSYGKRDAWAVGWNGRYTIGVWMGNFSGKGAPRLSGTVMAVPLLVDLFNAIDREGSDLGIPQPDVLERRRVCARTGLLPSPQCRELTDDWAIRDVSTKRRCELLQPFRVDAERRMHYCMDCLPDSGAEQAWYPVVDPRLSVWFEENNVGIERPPPHNPGCTARQVGEGPEILSPTADYTYYLERGAKQEILLQAASPPGVRRQFWYADGDLIGEVDAGGRQFFRPTGKRHRISCMDDAGRERSVEIEIVFF